MAGHTACYRRPLRARLEEAVEPAPGKDTYLRCRLEREAGGWSARLSGPQGSGVLSALARADGLLVVPAAGGRLEAGAEADILPLSEGLFREAP